MTNEEAIKVILFAKRDILADSDNDKAFDMAIEALKAQDVPDMNVGDMISRQAAIAVADSSDYVGLSVEDVKKVTDEVVKGLKQLPSAQPEPEPVGCSGCRYERFGNRVCDVCSRFYVDRYEYKAERRTDE